MKISTDDDFQNPEAVQVLGQRLWVLQLQLLCQKTQGSVIEVVRSKAERATVWFTGSFIKSYHPFLGPEGTPGMGKLVQIEPQLIHGGTQGNTRMKMW